MSRGERGGGRVYLRGGRWWIQYNSRGQKYRESSYSGDRRDASRQLRHRLAEVATGRHAPAAERVVVEDLLDMVRDDYRLNGRRSLPRAETAFKHLQDAFSGFRALDLTPDRLTTYARERREAGAAVASVAYELAMLKRGFSLGVRAGRLQVRPAFPVLTVDNARGGYFEEPEFRRLQKCLSESLRPPMTFAYLTGWRLISEVLSLRWGQVDLAAGTVRIEPGSSAIRANKTKQGRTFPIGALPELAWLLEEQRRITTEAERRLGAVIPWVFHRNGKPIRDFRKGWRVACAKTGLVGMIPHDFRRTAVRNLERAAVPRSVAMQLVGHKTEAMYRRYAIVAERDLAEGVAKLAAFRAAAPGSRTMPEFQGRGTKEAQFAG